MTSSLFFFRLRDWEGGGEGGGGVAWERPVVQRERSEEGVGRVVETCEVLEWVPPCAREVYQVYILKSSLYNEFCMVNTLGY
jgi:hypothetical protein